MPSDVLHSLGFVLRPSPHSGSDTWTHPRSPGQFFHQILTPDQVTHVLIEIGHGEFRRRALSVLSNIDMDDTDDDE